ncbi:MAG: fibronectin type III domain-containing protein, partial [Planctomycetota bacterium]
MGRERSAAAGLAVRAASLAFLALLAVPALAGESDPDARPPVHHTSLRRFSIVYDVPEDTARVRLWVTENGGADWRPYGYDSDKGPPKSPVAFATDRDGTYGFVVQPEDRAGNRLDPSAGAPPQLVMIVDTAPPKVELLAPNDGFVGPQRGAVVQWRASDEYINEDSARVECSTDGGASWVELAAGRSRVGSFTWDMKDVEPPDARSFRFRVTARDMAGNSASVVSREDVLLDDELPTARATGSEGPAGGDVEVTYEADDAAGAGVESVRLYASADDGDTWELVATDDDARPPVLWRAARTGSYGLFAAATDRAGNASPAPEQGAEAHVTVEVRRSLEVRLGTLHTGGYYKGGATQPVTWEVKGPAPAGCAVRLDYSIDGGDSWEEIVSGLDSSGEFRWT